MRRIIKAAFGGLAGCALALGGTQVASGVLSDFYKEQSENLLTNPDLARPFDYAKATVTITVDDDGNNTKFRIDLTKIDTSQIDPSLLPLGSHLHTGPCIEEMGTSAGPHYNHDVVTKNKSLPTGEKIYGYTAEVSPSTEVWFDLTPGADGTASGETTVPFVPVDPDGIMSVVVHVGGTNTAYGVPYHSDQVAGFAGARQACFPLSSVSGIFPATVTK